MFKYCTFGDGALGGKISLGKRDLFAIPQDLPTLLQPSPGTNGMPKNLLRPAICLYCVMISFWKGFLKAASAKLK